METAALPTPPSTALPPDGIEIRHVDLEHLPERLTGEPTRALVVFWCNQRPVGQAYVSLPLEGLVTAELAARAVDEEARRPLPLPATATRLTATVVICTRDRPAALTRCLASLSTQTRRADEIIVVDNGSVDDATRHLAARAGVRYLREDRPGLDVARNTGARAALGDIVAYTDDDVELHGRWLEAMVAGFDDGIDAVTGLVLPAELATPAQLWFERHWGFGRGFRRIEFGPEFLASDRREGCPVWKIGAGASMAFRRQVFGRVGGFDERLDAGAAGCSGDSEFWHRLLSHGMAIRYVPEAVGFHWHRKDWAELANQIFAYARGHAAALLIQHERTGNRGNLRRVWGSLPLYYGRRLLRLLVGRRRDADRFLGREIRGWASGVCFFYRTRKPGAVSARR